MIYSTVPGLCKHYKLVYSHPSYNKIHFKPNLATRKSSTLGEKAAIGPMDHVVTT